MKKRDIEDSSYSHLPYTKRWMSIDKEITNKDLWKDTLKEPLVVGFILATAIAFLFWIIQGGSPYVILTSLIITFVLMWISMIQDKNYLNSFEYVEKQRNKVTGEEQFLIKRTRFPMDELIKGSYLEVDQLFDNKESANEALEACSKKRLEFCKVLYEKSKV